MIARVAGARRQTHTNLGERRIAVGTIVLSVDLVLMRAKIDVIEKPIERIRETCEMVGAAEKFERVLPELETYLKREVAGGETSETRLTFDGLCFLKQTFSRP